MATTAIDHYETRTIDELAEVTRQIKRLTSMIPLTAEEKITFAVMVSKIDESIAVKRQAAPTVIRPRPRDQM